MFDHRLGLALHKSLGEIHALPYVEWLSWYTFYLLEPWGWWNEEVNFARLLTMIHNVNVSKKSDAKAPKDYVRDMVEQLLGSLKEQPDIESLPIEERRRIIMQAIQQDFGIREGK